MSEQDKARLEADVAEAQAELARLRAENNKAAAAYREDRTEAGRGTLKKAAAALAQARDRLAAAKGALAVLEKTGSLHGLIAENGLVLGTVAVAVKGGSTREVREAAIEAELNEKLYAIAEELGVVLAARPAAFTRERLGRDAEGRTVLDVHGLVEGDRLVPAVSRAAKHAR